MSHSIPTGTSVVRLVVLLGFNDIVDDRLFGEGKGLVPVGTVVLSAAFCSGVDAVVQLGFVPRNGRKFRTNNRIKGCFFPHPPRSHQV
jgi:hypothetical protein